MIAYVIGIKCFKSIISVKWVSHGEVAKAKLFPIFQPSSKFLRCMGCVSGPTIQWEFILILAAPQAIQIKCTYIEHISTNKHQLNACNVRNDNRNIFIHLTENLHSLRLGFKNVLSPGVYEERQWTATNCVRGQNPKNVCFKNIRWRQYLQLEERYAFQLKQTKMELHTQIHMPKYFTLRSYSKWW